MSIFEPKYETYQDLKHTLAWWATLVWAFVFFLFTYLVLRPDIGYTVIVKYPPAPLAP